MVYNKRHSELSGFTDFHLCCVIVHRITVVEATPNHGICHYNSCPIGKTTNICSMSVVVSGLFWYKCLARDHFFLCKYGYISGSHIWKDIYFALIEKYITVLRCLGTEVYRCLGTKLNLGLRPSHCKNILDGWRLYINM